MLLPSQEGWTSARSLSCMGINTVEIFFPPTPASWFTGSPGSTVHTKVCLPVTDAQEEEAHQQNHSTSPAGTLIPDSQPQDRERMKALEPASLPAEPCCCGSLSSPAHTLGPEAGASATNTCRRGCGSGTGRWIEAGGVLRCLLETWVLGTLLARAQVHTRHM
uniref:Uncharacterized protein n=1 Tax=Pipistrellus kuhlii TaxID=59472 RepID=A0A7J7WL99_PIPKU|nr:hypothetical protein mPipKuh1_007933 [Pipistrellus kuhlii]